MVTLYSTPTCAPCRAAERALNSAGVPFQKVDLTTDPAALESLKARTNTTVLQTPMFDYRGELHTMTGLRDIIADATA